MVDLAVPIGVDSETLISAATGHDSLSVDDRDWTEWLKKRENKLKSIGHQSHPNHKESTTPLLKMVREAEEEEDQWLQSLRDELGTTLHSSDSEAASDSPSTPSILDTLAAAPTAKPVSRRASSHITETPAALGVPSKSVTSQNIQKKRSSVVSHSASSSSIAADGKTSGSGKEVKTFFENFLTPGASPAAGVNSQKK